MIGGISGYQAQFYQNTLRIVQNASMYKTTSYQAVSAVDKLSGVTPGSSTAEVMQDTVGFLKNYEQKLTSLEQASKDLQMTEKENVFSKYEEAVKISPEAADKAKEEIVSAVDDFVDKYNDVTSYLQKNIDRGGAVASHLQSFQREQFDQKSLNAVGISYNDKGELELDEDKLKEALDKDYENTKNLLGGQYSLSERTAQRAKSALDTSVQRLAGNDITKVLESGKVNNSQNNYFRYMTNFARSGPYNMTNYYAVGLLLNTQV